MSRRIIITCDLCQQEVPVVAESWRNFDVLRHLRGQLPAGCRGARGRCSAKGVTGADGFVGPEDVIPERTRARRPAPKSG